MNTYVALLRGINVSGQKKMLMADLRKLLSNSGLHNVKTYIQSGNVVFESDIEDKVVLEEKIKAVILSDYGFEVPILVTTKEILVSILENSPYAKEESKKQYFALLRSNPEPFLATEFNKIEYQNEDFHITNECIYLFCKEGAGKAKLNNNLIERKLKVQATTRNLNTMKKLIDMAKE